MRCCCRFGKQSVRSTSTESITARCRADNVLVDTHGDIWLTGFADAEVDGPHAHQAQDVAEALVSMSLLTSSERAVSTAVSVLGADTHRRSAAPTPAVGPQPGDTASACTAIGSLERAPVEGVCRDRKQEVELAQLERVRPRTMVIVVGAFVGMWVFLPTLANAGDTVDALRANSTLCISSPWCR